MPEPLLKKPLIAAHLGRAMVRLAMRMRCLPPLCGKSGMRWENQGQLKLPLIQLVCDFANF